MLIVLEGIDGVGKTSVGRALAKRLNAGFREFPDRGSPTGELIDAYLKRDLIVSSLQLGLDGSREFDRDRRAGALVHQALQVCNRLEVLMDLVQATHPGVVGHNLSETDLVLARYTASGLVYGQLDGLDPTWLEGVLGVLPEADVNLLLELEPKLALERRAARDGAAVQPELYEGKLQMAEKLHGLYQQLWVRHHREPGWGVVDARLPFEVVVDACYEACVTRYLGRKAGDA